MMGLLYGCSVSGRTRPRAGGRPDRLARLPVPRRDVPVRAAGQLDRDMAHRSVGGGAVPMPDAAGYDGELPRLDEGPFGLGDNDASPRDHVEYLGRVMGVRAGPCAGLEEDGDEFCVF